MRKSGCSAWVGVAFIALMLIVSGCSKEGGDGGTTEFGASGQGNIGDPGDGSKFGLTSNAFLEINPDAVNFPEGISSSQKVTVSNVGSEGSLDVTAVYIKGGNTQFSVDWLSDKGRLGPLEFLEFDVSYAPGDGANSDVLVVEHTSGFQGPLQIPILVGEGSGFLNVSPGVLDYESVVLGESKELSVAIENLGTTVTALNTVEFGEDIPPDFTLVTTDIPETIAPGEIVTVSVSYTPDGTGSDTGQLIVVGGDDSEEFIVQLEGTVLGPSLTAIPGVIDFGYVTLGNSKEIDVVIRNVGTAPTEVEKVSLDGWTSPFVTLVDGGTLPLTLEEGEDFTVKLEFTPEAGMPEALDPIGRLLVESKELPPLDVSIYGNAASPEIFVNPEFLDFGLVANGDTVYRDLVVLNKGKETLEVLALTLEEGTSSEFEVVEFAPSNWEVPGVVGYEESITVTVAFTNTTGQQGDVEQGTLAIDSNDLGNSPLIVGMEAKRGGAKKCVVEVSPAVLNYAIVPHGFTKTMPVTIKNVGSGPCTYLSTTTYDCDAIGGLFGAGGCSQGIGGTSKYFKVVAQPPPVPEGIGQGESVAVQIMFVPPDDAPLFEFFDTYQGAFQITVTDPSDGGSVIQSPIGAVPEDLSANLVAQSGISDISVIPSTVDFGLVTIGCASPEQKITIYNNGNAPLFVSDISLVDCTPEFELSQVPPIPPEGLEVNQQSPVEVSVQYKPQVPETSFCTLSIQSTDQDQALLTVPLQGTGTYETEQTDKFTQLSGQMVDILFVVDDSGSMAAEQANLAQNFNALMQEAIAWGTEFQMGVVTTDIKKDSASGRLQGSPKIVTPGPSSENQFKSNVQVGDSGAGEQEAGLEAASQALSMPLIYEGTNTSCSADSDCESYGTGLTCTNGKCAGWNAGFLRQDAALELVFVSDEEDQSPGPLNFYIDFFKSIKGFANEGLMHAHAIVGDENSGCSSDNGDAGAGDRYIEVAKQTGGKFGSICDDNFATVLASIGEVAFGLKVQFFLSANAEPGTVEVSINGTTCEQDWTYEDSSNSVIFEAEGACMPQEDDEISIYYKMLCL